MSTTEDSSASTETETTKRTRKVTPMRIFQTDDTNALRAIGPEFFQIGQAKAFLAEHVTKTYDGEESPDIPTFTIQRVLGTFSYKRKTTVSFVETGGVADAG